MSEEEATGLPDGWHATRFDEILERVDRKITIDDGTEYSRVGVRWYGNGAFIRDRLLGDDIARKQQWIIRAADVVYNKLFAWKGAFAVADEAVDGHLVSDKFPTYALNTAKVDARYLGHYFRTHQLAFQAERLSKGAAAISKLTLNPPQLWDLVIPLPSLAEQEQLVETLDGAEAKLIEAERLRTEAQAEVAALVTAAVTGWRYRPTEYKRTSEITHPDGRYWLQPGDLLMTRSNTELLLGHAAIYSGEPSPCIYPDLMMRLKVDPKRAATRFVYYWLMTPDVRARIQKAGSGTSSTMKKITQKDVMGLPFPVATTIAEQRAAVVELDEVVSRIDDARSAQQCVEQNLAALMPALLDRAFQGELDLGAGVASARPA